MSHKYEKLLSPYQLNDRVTLKNHITFPNGQHGLTQGPEAYPSEGMFAEIADLCTSGASLLSFSHFGSLGGGAPGDRKCNENKDRAHFPIYDYDNPAVHNYICQMAAMVHMHGSRLLVKLAPRFPDGYTYGGGDIHSLFPTPQGYDITGPYARPNAKVYTMEEMKARICPREKFPEVIGQIVDMAKKYKKWGWDGMSIRCDRLINASDNLREDEYNGEIENRGRFCYELFSAVKKEVGSDFLIEAVLMGKQDHGEDGSLPHGYTLEEAVRFGKLICDVVDIIQIREHLSAGYHSTGYNSQPHVHHTLKYCRAFKEGGVTCAITAGTGFIDPEDMENALQSGDCDLICAARVFIAEPQFIKKLTSDGAEAPTPCVHCNICHGLGRAPWLPYCTVNPKACVTHRLPAMVKPPLRSKKVAVIGGGVIGMRTACFAAEKGHSVTLFEKTDYLGGKLRYADMYSFKWPFKRYRLWLVDELKRRGVVVRMNCAPTPDQLRAENFDAVIACTGSREKRPPIEGADLEGVWTSEDIYESKARLGQRVVVVGGGHVATETAMYLAEIGKDVTILSRGKGLLINDDHRPHGPHIMFEKIIPEYGYGGSVAAWSKYDNLEVIMRAQTVKITPTSVTYVRDGEEVRIECDSVVVNGGYRGCKEEALQYVGCAQEFYLAGDVEDDICGNIQEGNASAYGKACLL